MQNLNCQYLGKCGGCTINAPYQAQLESKKSKILEIFDTNLAKADFSKDDVEVFASPMTQYRARAEFRIFREVAELSKLSLAKISLAMMGKETAKKETNKEALNNATNSATDKKISQNTNPKTNQNQQAQKAIKIPIKSCQILLPNISLALKSFIDLVNDLASKNHALDYEILAHKLYAIEALGIANPHDKNLANKNLANADFSTKSLSVILTLIYHKKLDSKWEQKIKELSKNLPTSLAIIGRSKNQKIILKTDTLLESITLKNHQKYVFLRSEGRFSQPNAFVNPLMISFVKSAILPHRRKDLLEMYCGEGNFCVSLASDFGRVLATEVVKSAIPALQINAKNNGIKNITALRLSGEESIDALSGKREFFRARGVDLEAFRFSHILIDPPRSGISGSEFCGVGEIDKEKNSNKNSKREIFENMTSKNNDKKNDKNTPKQSANTPKQSALKMLDFIARHDYIIYISCNPFSLKNDLEILQKSHKITHFAIFDQFPHTHHIESALVLEKRKDNYKI